MSSEIFPEIPNSVTSCEIADNQASLPSVPSFPMPQLTAKQQRLLVVASAYMVNVVSITMQLYSSPLYWKQPYHTSKLSGKEWVNELINGHYDRIWHELGMRVHVFLALVHELCVTCNLMDSQHIGVNELLRTIYFLHF